MKSMIWCRAFAELFFPTATTMGFWKNLMCWRKRSSKKTQRKEETHGGEPSRTTKQQDAPLVQDDSLIMEAPLDQVAPLVLEAPLDEDDLLVWEALLYQDAAHVPEAPHNKVVTLVLEASFHREAMIVLETALDEDDPLLLEAPLVPEAPLPLEDLFVMETPPDYDTPGEWDAISEHTKEELLYLKEEAELLKELFQQTNEELQQLYYVERCNSTAATGEEGQLLQQEENPPHFSLWWKVKLVAGAVFMGLVAHFLATL